MKILKAVTLSVISVSLLAGCVPDQTRSFTAEEVEKILAYEAEQKKLETKSWIDEVGQYLLPYVSDYLFDRNVQASLYQVADEICDQIARNGVSETVRNVEIAGQISEPVIRSGYEYDFVSVTKDLYC